MWNKATSPSPSPVGGWLRPLAALFDALPDALLALCYVLTWLQPRLLPASTPRWLMLVMLLEFIIIHASAFMMVAMVRPRARIRTALALTGLGLFYSLFVGAFCLAFHEWWPLVSFWGLMLNRMLGVLLAPHDAAPALPRDVGQAWAVGTVVYVLGVFATTFLPVPALGLAGLGGTALGLPGHGLWISEPYRLMAVGFIYFGVQAWVALSRLRGPARSTPSK